MAANANTKTVGLVATWIDCDYWLRILAGAAEVLGSEGYTPVCFTLGASTRPEPRTQPPFFELVNRQFLSGVMVISTGSFQNDAESFLQPFDDLPAVCVGRRVQNVPSLWVQNALGIRMLMKHLTEVCDRRRIAFIRGTEKNLEAEARFRAWEDFCVERSLPWDAKMVEQGEFTEATGEAAALRLFEKNAAQLPDALVVSNDRMALGVLNAARKKGLKVPDDISVVGFDDLEAAQANPPLSTVRQPVFEMGQRAAETLVALMRKGPVTLEQMFAPELIVRASCRPNQTSTECRTECCGFGARAFLDGAYPSPDKLIQEFRKLLSNSEQDPAFTSTHFEQLACALEKSLTAAKVRDNALTASVRELRLHTLGRLEQSLSQANSVLELNSVVQAHLQLLGLNRLTVATVADESGFRGEARLLLDCSVGSKAPIGTPNSWISSAKLVAAHAQRDGGTMRIVQPLYNENDACGLLVSSGTLIDGSILNRIGVALSRATLRIGG